MCKLHMVLVFLSNLLHLHDRLWSHLNVYNNPTCFFFCNEYYSTGYLHHGFSSCWQQERDAGGRENGWAVGKQVGRELGDCATAQKIWAAYSTSSLWGSAGASGRAAAEGRPVCAEHCGKEMPGAVMVALAVHDTPATGLRRYKREAVRSLPEGREPSLQVGARRGALTQEPPCSGLVGRLTVGPVRRSSPDC